MKKFLFAVMALLPAIAFAQPGWQYNGIAVVPADAGKVVAALDALMAEAVKQGFKGRVLLQSHVADGMDPATHGIVSLFHSAAERETFNKKMAGTDAMAKFYAAMPEVESAGTTRGSMLRSWGDLSDKDMVWMTFSFDVSNPAGFVAAVERYMASDVGKSFPGQLHLAAAVAGGDGVSHMLIAGFESEAEWEAWSASIRGTADQELMLRGLGDSSEYLGAALARDVKHWGSASMKSFKP